MIELPAGWRWEAIEDVAEVRLGRQRSPSRASGPHMRPYMRAANVSWKGIDLSDVKEMDFTPAEFETFELLPGDVLVGEASGSRLEVGKSAVWRGEVPGACFQNTLIRIRTGDRLLPEYLQKHLLYDARRGALADISKGIGIHHLGAKGLAQWKIAVPPLEEQKRIADKLDALLARVDACRERLDRVPEILTRCRAMVLAAAASGRLVADSERVAGKRLPWRKTTFGAVGRVTGGITKNAARQNASLSKPYLRVANVYANRLELGEISRIATTPEEFERTRLRSGDVLIVEGNGSEDQIGRAALWRGEIAECAHQNHLIRWRTEGSVLPEWALLWLLSPVGREALAGAAKSSAGLYTLSLSKVAAVPLLVPPVTEQAEIVERVTTLLGHLDALVAQFAALRTRMGELSSSVLTKAFRGEISARD